MKKLTLLQQAYIEQRRRGNTSLSLMLGGGYDGTNMNMSQRLELILPKYDQRIKPKLFHAATQLHKGMKGGVGSGKTVALCAEAIGISELNKPYLHLALNPTFDIALTTYVVELQRLCDENNLEYDWVKATQKFRIVHGNRNSDIANIMVIGADQFFKGLTAASGDINEPFSIKKPSILVWWERIRDHRSRRLQRSWGGTAEPETMEWGHEYFKKDKIETKDFYCDTMTTYENRKYLPEGYIESLEEKYDEKRRQVYLLGKNISLAGGTVYNFDEQKHTIPHAELERKIMEQETLKVVLGFDFNIDPICCTEHCIIGDVRYQADEYTIHGSNTDEICPLVINRVKEKYKNIKIVVYVTGDATGASPKSSSQGRSDHKIVAEYFSRSGLKVIIHFEKTNPEQRIRVNDVNKLIETGRYVISDKCVETIKDRELVKWKKGAEKYKIDKSDDERTHHSDSADYGLLLTLRMGIDKVKSSDEEKSSGILGVNEREDRY